MKRRLTTALGITAAVLGAGTAAATEAGTAPLLSSPQHEVQYVVEEGLRHNITQQSVEAAHRQNPARSWVPLTFRVTDDGLTSAQRLNGTDLDEDVVLSIGTGGIESPDGRWRTHGVAYRDGLAPLGMTLSTFDAERAYQSNRNLGHGPTAVLAAAHTAGEAVYSGPTRSPLLWLSLILGGASATLLTLVWWARRRRRESAVERAFRAGRFHLARREQAVEVLWRLKSEIPDLVDPATGDLKPGAMIVPVILRDEEQGGVMAPAVVDMAVGTRSQLAVNADCESVPWDEVGDMGNDVVGELESYSRMLPTNGVDRPQTGEARPGRVPPVRLGGARRRSGRFTPGGRAAALRAVPGHRLA